MPQPARHRLAWAAWAAWAAWVPAAVTASSASAQTAPGTAPAPAAAAASAPLRAAPTAPAASAPGQRIEVTGGRGSDTDERRRSTASKIVIGREEIDKFGDATVGEVLRRLPGVTTPGAPGRGGSPRLRGLGSGYTQLLIDGQRIPPGFNLESLTPEQVERIEILRAPTAETGARAIAGTINIVLREGYRRRLNDLRVGFGHENSEFSPGITWSHNDSVGDLIYTVSAAAFKPHRRSSNLSTATVTDVATGALLEDHRSASTTTENRSGAHLSGRLQWRLGEGESLVLMPSVFQNQGTSASDFTLLKALARPCAPGQVVGCSNLPYDAGHTEGDSRQTNARLGLQWRQRVGAVRVETNAAAGSWQSTSHSLRNEFAGGAAAPVRKLDDSTRARERSLTAGFKGSMVAGGESGASGPGSEHALVFGGEVDASRRQETRTSLQNNEALLVDFGDELEAAAMRLAAYVQDEWALSPHWAVYAGLRWEGIATRGDSGSDRPRNRSSVWTPLLHAVWKPDPKGRDQVRMSLTRSYRSPSLGSLVARPAINRDYDPLLGSNRETSPDSAGNPQLKPEMATGIDVAVERYLQEGGVLSANVFHRRIANLMRGVTTLETVSWSADPRWVRRQQNIGGATTTGAELEAKFRLDQLVSGARPVEVRANLALHRSRVERVPGPDNRLDQQARASGNVGADYRLRGTPLTLGGNVNWVPETTTRLEADQTVTVSSKRVWDAYALWTFTPAAALRVLASNLAPRDWASTTVDDSVVANAVERTTARSVGPSYVNWQFRLELKL